jgi:hypothetical protein
MLRRPLRQRSPVGITRGGARRKRQAYQALTATRAVVASINDASSFFTLLTRC